MKVRENTAEVLAVKTSNNVQIWFYTFANFFAKNIIEGFFDDVVHMSAAAMLATFAIVNIAVSVYFFADSVKMILSHEVPTYSLIFCFIAWICAKLSAKLARHLLAESDDAGE